MRGAITTERELDALPRPMQFPLTAARAAKRMADRRSRGSHTTPQGAAADGGGGAGSAAPVSVPPPAAGAFYTQQEIAVLAGVALKTVHNWVASGRVVAGEVVRLRTLDLPKSAVAPEDLAAFLSAVNRRPVDIQ